MYKYNLKHINSQESFKGSSLGIGPYLDILGLAPSHSARVEDLLESDDMADELTFLGSQLSAVVFFGFSQDMVGSKKRGEEKIQHICLLKKASIVQTTNVLTCCFFPHV